MKCSPHNLNMTPECKICFTKGKKKDYENQWFCDMNGYSRCIDCGEKCDQVLPKNCGCLAHDTEKHWMYEDGKFFCTTYDKEWNGKYTQACSCSERCT